MEDNKENLNLYYNNQKSIDLINAESLNIEIKKKDLKMNNLETLVKTTKAEAEALRMEKRELLKIQQQMVEEREEWTTKHENTLLQLSEKESALDFIKQTLSKEKKINTQKESIIQELQGKLEEYDKKSELFVQEQEAEHFEEVNLIFHEGNLNLQIKNMKEELEKGSCNYKEKEDLVETQRGEICELKAICLEKDQEVKNLQTKIDNLILDAERVVVVSENLESRTESDHSEEINGLNGIIHHLGFQLQTTMDQHSREIHQLKKDFEESLKKEKNACRKKNYATGLKLSTAEQELAKMKEQLKKRGTRESHLVLNERNFMAQIEAKEKMIKEQTDKYLDCEKQIFAKNREIFQLKQQVQEKEKELREKMCLLANDTSNKMKTSELEEEHLQIQNEFRNTLLLKTDEIEILQKKLDTITITSTEKIGLFETMMEEKEKIIEQVKRELCEVQAKYDILIVEQKASIQTNERLSAEENERLLNIDNLNTFSNQQKLALESLKEKYHALKTEKETILQEHTSTIESLEETKRLLLTRNQQTNNAENAITSLKNDSEISRLEKEEQIRCMNLSLETIERNNATLLEENIQRKDELLLLEQNVSEKKGLIDNLEVELAVLRNQCTELSQKNEILNKNLGDQEQILQAETLKTKNLLENNQILYQQHNESQEYIKKIEKNLKDINLLLTEKCQQSDLLINELKETQTIINNKQTALSSLHAEFEGLQNENEKHCLKLNSLKDYIFKLEEITETLEQYCHQVETDKENIQTEQNNGFALHAALQKTCDDYQKQINTLTLHNSSLENQLCSYEVKINEGINMRENMQKQCANLILSNTNLETRISTELNPKLDHFKLENKLLEADKNILINENASLKLTFENFQNSNQQLQKELTNVIENSIAQEKSSSENILNFEKQFREMKEKENNLLTKYENLQSSKNTIEKDFEKSQLLSEERILKIENEMKTLVKDHGVKISLVESEVKALSSKNLALEEQYLAEKKSLTKLEENHNILVDQNLKENLANNILMKNLKESEIRYKERSQGLAEEIEQTKRHNETLHIDISEKEATNMKLLSKNNQLISELKTANEMMKINRVSYENIEQKKFEIEQECSKLQKEILILQKEYSLTNSQLTNQVETLEKELKEGKEVAKALENVDNDLIKKYEAEADKKYKINLDNLQKKVDQQNESIANQKESIDAMKKEKTDDDEVHAFLLQDNDDLQKRIQLQVQGTIHLQEKYDLLFSDSKQLKEKFQQQLDTQEKEFQLMKTQIVNQELEIQKLQKQKNSLESELSKCSNEGNMKKEASDEIEQKMETLKKENTRLLEEILSLKDAQEDLVVLKRDLKITKSNLTRAKNQFEKFKQEKELEKEIAPRRSKRLLEKAKSAL